MKKGKFIAIYGINGIGKTTQVEILVKYLQSQGLNVSRLKYPVYNLELLHVYLSYLICLKYSLVKIL